MKKLILFFTLFSITANSGLPPTATKASGDTSYLTTFKTNYGAMNATRSGVVLTPTMSGSGNLVLSSGPSITSPTLIAPNIGAATGSSLSVTGQLTSTVATGTAPLVVSSTTNVANLYAARATVADNFTDSNTYRVGPGRTYTTIQSALTAIGASTTAAEFKAPKLISIAGGMYDESLTIPDGRIITLQAEGQVILGDGAGSHWSSTTPRSINWDPSLAAAWSTGLKPSLNIIGVPIIDPTSTFLAEGGTFRISGSINITETGGGATGVAKSVNLSSVKIDGQASDSTTALTNWQMDRVYVVGTFTSAAGILERLGSVEFDALVTALGYNSIVHSDIGAGMTVTANQNTLPPSGIFYSTLTGTFTSPASGIKLDPVSDYFFTQNGASLGGSASKVLISGNIGGNSATVTTNANLTGHVTSTGNAAVLGSFTSANLLTAITNETGTGLAVFNDTPTLIAPLLGTPTSGVATNITGLPLTSGVTGILPEVNGGTDQSTYTVGDILYSSSTNNLSKLAIGTETKNLKVVSGQVAWAEEDRSNLLVNPAIEGTNSGGVATGWTNSSSASTATITTASGEFSEGLQAQKIAQATGAVSYFQSVSIPAGAPAQHVVGVNYRIPSTFSDAQICTTISGVEVTCASSSNSLILDNAYHSIEIPETATPGSTLGLKIKTIAAKTGNIFIDKAYIRQTGGGNFYQATGSASAIYSAANATYDWTNYGVFTADTTLYGQGTMTGNANGYPCKHRRDGGDLEMQCDFTGGTAAATLGAIVLPIVNGSQLTIDTAEILRSNTTAADGVVVGRWSTGGGNTLGNVVTATATATDRVYVGGTFNNAAMLKPALISSYVASTQAWSIYFKVPISGWNNLSQITASLASYQAEVNKPVVRAYASATSISGSLATVAWTTEEYDSHAALSSGTFTCPVAGKYQVNAAIAMSGTFALNSTITMQIQKNGTAVSEDVRYAGGAVTQMDVAVSDVVTCAIGDTIRVQAANGGTLPVIVTSNTRNYLSIAWIGL